MKFKLTDMGRVMEAQLVAGSKPIITKIEASDAYSSNEGALLSVQNRKQELEIQEIAVIEGASHLKFVLHNVGLAEEYMLRQIGIYAKQDEDAEEILYIIGQDKAGERVPASTEKHVDYEYDLMINTDNAYEVQVVVKPSFFATKEELNETNAKVDGLLNPEFDDSGSVAGIKSFPDFLKTMVSRSSIFQFLRNAKAGFQFVLHTGALVNNCTSTASNLPLAAAQGKVLMDMITKLNSEKINAIICFSTNKKVTISGNGLTSVEIPVSMPSGYIALGIIDAWCTGFDLVTINRYWDTNGINVAKVHIRNLSSNNREDDVYVRVLAIRSSLFASYHLQ